MHREIITDPAKIQEIEAALRNKQAASALAEVVTGEHPEFGLVVLVKTDKGDRAFAGRRAVPAAWPGGHGLALGSVIVGAQPATASNAAPHAVRSRTYTSSLFA